MRTGADVAEDMPHLTARWTTAGGFRMFARVSEHPPDPCLPDVVLVHGLSVSSSYMVPIATRLARYARVYAPDLPGFGKSEKPPHALDVGELADALAEWMREVGVEPALLLGNSLGCQVIAELSLRYPERARVAVLVGPTMDPDAGALAQIWRLIRDSFHEPLRYLPLLLHDYLAAGISRTALTFRAALRHDAAAAYARMRIPTLVVRGAEDPIAPRRWIEFIYSRLHDGDTRTISGAGHAVNYNAAPSLARTVWAFAHRHGLIREQPGKRATSARTLPVP